MTVIVGSLMIGDSVRGTLRAQVDERLGSSQSIIFARESYLDESILETLPDAEGYLLMQGFISHNGMLHPVMVWGCQMEGDAVFINEPLAEELGEGVIENLVLRLPSAGMVPSGSLFVTDNYTTSLRLRVAGIRSSAEGGNMNLRTEQVLPFNIFLPHNILAEAMEVENKINLILSPRLITDGELLAAWHPHHSGLTIRQMPDYVEATSSRIFLQEHVVDRFYSADANPNRLYSYLANGIATERDTIPYSFVTALDSYAGIELDANEVILSDYSARRLGAKVGDNVRISYFRAEELKHLSTIEREFKVKAILPLEQLHTDKELSAEFPGLSDVERCTEWDSDLPLDMDLIEDEDEAYWEHYRQTPKALIAYSSVIDDWRSDYGSATALRLSSLPDLTALQPEMFGVEVMHPREDAIYAAQNGVDFSELFLALGFFIIVSALLLIYTPLLEMYENRRGEMQTLLTIGFTPARIRRMLAAEATPIVLGGVVIGIFAGILYTFIILWLLESVWHGATHTASFSLHFRPITILIGIIASTALTAAVVAWAIRGAVGKFDTERKGVDAITTKGIATRVAIFSLLCIATVVTYIYSLSFASSVLIAVVAGLCFMLTAMVGIDLWTMVRRYKALQVNTLSPRRIIEGSLYASRRGAMLSLLTLSFGVFITFVVGLNRRSFDNGAELAGATGGYDLWCETSVAMQHDPSTEAGRKELGIASQWSGEALALKRYGADDASCMNLNKISLPSVLGVDAEALEQAEFEVGDNIFDLPRRELFHTIRKPIAEDTYPAIVDATVLMWSLGKQLGDTLHYSTHDGRALRIIPVATFTGSIFHGNILIDSDLFDKSWPENNGCNIFLVRSNESNEMKQYLQQSLYEYGIRVTPTLERLETINEVTDTYLSIFMTLGSIGLLLGLLSFAIVVRKNLTRSAEDIRYYRLLGFSTRRIASILYEENIFIPHIAIISGVVGAIIGIGRGWSAVGVWIWIGGVAMVATMLILVRMFVRLQIEQALASRDITKIY
jgi:putative ABC transport system permease protein